MSASAKRVDLVVQFIGEHGAAGAEANPRGLTASVANGEVKKETSRL